MRLSTALAIVVAAGIRTPAEEMPAVGHIIVFGDIQIEKDVRQLLPSVPPIFDDAEANELRKKLAGSHLWRQSDFTYVCCESSGTAILYLGVKTTDERPRFRQKPSGFARLDAEDLALYDQLMAINQDAVFKSISRSEDDSAGHALSSYSPERNLQEDVIARAKGHVPRWRDVLLHCADPHQRAAAAYLLAYGPKDQMLADFLAQASSDSDPLVRNNAMRALGVLAPSAVSRRRHLRFDPEGLINLFQSVHWTDWNKASFALLALIDVGSPKLLHDIARRAGEPLSQIATWPSMHAKPGVVILQRIQELQ
jgi:rhodanese-related sulfurtransferase